MRCAITTSLRHDGDGACRRVRIIAGADWSLADAAATPYIWRLDKLKLAPLWNRRRGIAAWNDRIRARPSFKLAVDDWVSADDSIATPASPIPGRRWRSF